MELVDKLYGYLGSYLWRRGISCKVVFVTIRSEIQKSHFQSTFLVILGQNGKGSKIVVKVDSGQNRLISHITCKSPNDVLVLK